MVDFLIISRPRNVKKNILRYYLTIYDQMFSTIICYYSGFEYDSATDHQLLLSIVRTHQLLHLPRGLLQTDQLAATI